MQSKDNKRSEEYQERLFGKRFKGAKLSRVSLPRSAVRKVLGWIKKPKHFLVMVGPAGTGKTYFCAAMLDEMIDKVRHIRAYDERTLLKKVRNSIGESSKGDYLDCLRVLLDDDLIILDDIGSSGHTDWREEVLMEAIDYRYYSMLPTIVTSNLYKKEFFETYGQRITSRLFAAENTIIDLSDMKDLREEGR